MAEEYSVGIHNRLAKLYFYCNTGLNLLNNFKNIILVIFAAYFALKIDNYIWMVVMLVVSIPILIFIGWYCVHYMNSVTEWLGVRYGSHYAKRQFALQEEIRDLLKELNNK